MKRKVKEGAKERRKEGEAKIKGRKKEGKKGRKK